MPMEYPVTRPYTIPNLTTYASILSVIVIAGLIVLNVILQGYEVVTVLRPDPNVTESYWWTLGPLSTWRSAGKCGPVSLSRQSNFRTNSSLFSYEIRSMFDSSGNKITGATPYMANSLSSCRVEGIMLIADINRSKFDTLIRCMGTNLPFSLSLVSSFVSNLNPYQDDFGIYYTLNKPVDAGLNLSTNTTNIIPLNASSLTNVMGIVDALNTDLYMAFAFSMGQNTSASARPIRVTSGGAFGCLTGDNAVCRAEDQVVSIPEAKTDYANGTIDLSHGPGPVLSVLEQSMSNLLIAMRDAYHIDLGNIQSSNILLNKDAFNTLVKPDKFLVSAIESDPDIEYCTVGFGCTRGTTWVQRLLSSDSSVNLTLPTILPTGDAPTVIRTDYLCPSYRIKRTGSLITSVFIGTWSMYMALVGIFNFLGPILEQRYGHDDMPDHADVSSDSLSKSKQTPRPRNSWRKVPLENPCP